MRRLVVTAAVTLFASTAAADGKRPVQVEASVAWGLGRASSSTFDSEGASSVRNGGLGLAAHLAVRFRHPVMPFVEVGYSPLRRSDEQVDAGAWGGRSVASGRLDAWWVLVGPEVPVGPLRLWGGIGLYQLGVRTTVFADTATSVDRTLGYGVGAAWSLLSRDAFRVGVAGRVLLMSEAEIAVYHGGFFLGFVFPP